MQLIVMEDRHQLIKRAAVQADYQPSQNQRHRREAFAPRHTKHQRADNARPGKRGELRRQHARDRPQRGDRHAQLRPGRYAERRRFRQRVT